MNSKNNYTIWLHPETNDLIMAYYKLDNCPTKSNFVEKAIRFYSSYLASKGNSEYISSAISDSVETRISAFENRMAKLLFKVCVEQAVMMNVIACYHKVEPYQINRLRGQCVEEIKRTKGNFNFSNAVEWQQEKIRRTNYDKK